MSNKKTLAVTAFALLLSQQSFASDTEGFYFGGGYHGQFFNSMGSLKAKTQDITHVSIGGDHAGAKGQLLSEYKPNYTPLFAASMAFGYGGELGNSNYRAELEGMYSSVKVDNIGLEDNKAKIMYQKKVTMKVQGSSDQKKLYGYGTKVGNDKVENASVMANAYYYWKNDNFSFSPYVGAGVGVTRIGMLGTTSIRPAYQLKAGLDYSISENINMHVGYRHFGVVGGDFKLATNLLNVEESGALHKATDVEKAQATGKDSINIGSGLFATHGVEAGLTFHFASQA